MHCKQTARQGPKSFGHASISCTIHFLNLLFSLSRSWFSKLTESVRLRLDVKSRPAQLKSRSHAAEAGRAAFSLRESFLMAGKEWSRSMLSMAQLSSSTGLCDFLGVGLEKKLPSLDDSLCCCWLSCPVVSSCCFTYVKPVIASRQHNFGA